jgi:hypothetical protein
MGEEEGGNKDEMAGEQQPAENDEIKEKHEKTLKKKRLGKRYR